MQISLNVYNGNLHSIHDKIHRAVKLTILLLYFNQRHKILVLKRGHTGTMTAISFSYQTVPVVIKSKRNAFAKVWLWCLIISPFQQLALLL